MLKVIPEVKKIEYLGGKLDFTQLNCSEKLYVFEKNLLSEYLSNESKYQLRFLDQADLPDQAYRLIIDRDGATIYSASKSGRQYALITLWQLLRQGEVREVSIYDEPDFLIRSVMIDISRNKVPKLETLFLIVDQLALAKINDLQLYVEGRSFYYDSFANYYENKEDFLTGENVLALRAYCEERMISLTPNMNCFGHMNFWLNQKEFQHLALNQQGFRWTENGLKAYAGTLDPNKAKAKEFVYTLFADMLKYYPETKYFTVGGDEPFELLFPKRNPDAEKIYANYMKDILENIRKKGIVPMMWGDVAKENPDYFDLFGDVVFLEWGYHPGDFNDKNCSIYHRYGKDFIVAAGTSLWNSFSGRSNIMLKNFQEASHFGKKYGAKGMMITDWGDGGSLSQLVSSLITYWLGAAYAWNGANVNLDAIYEFLDDSLYFNPISKSIIELGNYYECQDEKLFNITKLFITFFVHQLDGINFDIGNYSDPSSMLSRSEVLNFQECIQTEKFLNDWFSSLKIKKDNQFTKELIFVYRLINHSLQLNKVFLKIMNIDVQAEEIKELLNDLNRLIKEYNEIWFYRNKKSDFKFSIYRFYTLKEKYENLLYRMETSRWQM